MEIIPAKTILSACKKSELWFSYEYNMNLYRGCSHGCIYCDSRSECYGIEDFGQVKAKANALSILEAELSHKRKKGMVATGAMSDPYNPLEKNLCLTREALELLYRYDFGAAIFTKSHLITRDIAILEKINAHHPVFCGITVTAAADSLSKIIEPYAPLSSQRFEALKTLSDAQIYTGILLMPMLPWITDTQENLEQLIYSAKESGANFIYPMFGVTLRDRQRDYFYENLDTYFPTLKERYIRTYGERYLCKSPHVKVLWQSFQRLCRQYGLAYQIQDINQGYRQKTAAEQLTLF